MLSPSRLHRRTSRGPLPRSSSGCRYSQDMRVSLLQSKPLSGRGGFSAGTISGFLGASPFPASPQFMPGLCARSSGPKTGRPVTSSIAPRERAGRVRRARCLRVVGIALIQKSEWWSRQAFSRCWLFSRAHGPGEPFTLDAARIPAHFLRCDEFFISFPRNLEMDPDSRQSTSAQQPVG